jgi:coproporphyrinogen III oxidase-like Fe-S oxidoreductase
MYRDKRFHVKEEEAFLEEIEIAAAQYPSARRIFLADGDAMVLSTVRLERILDRLNASFPQLQRVTAYANPANLLGKTVDELRGFREKKLSILYYGVETGDPDLLVKIDKGATPDEMAEGCSRATEAGIKLSVTVILGLAGKEGSLRHARMTAELLNRIQPRYLSALTLMLGPWKESYASSMGAGFEFNSALDDIRELRELVSGLETDKCIFRSNHASNYLALKGTLLKDRAALLDEIDRALDDPDGHLRPEWVRGL